MDYQFFVSKEDIWLLEGFAKEEVNNIIDGGGMGPTFTVIVNGSPCVYAYEEPNGIGFTGDDSAVKTFETNFTGYCEGILKEIQDLGDETEV
jgi:hypothetical protein